MPWKKRIPKDAPPKQKDITQYKSLGHFLEPFISQLSGMSQEEMQKVLYEGTHSEEAYVSDQYAKWVMDNAAAQDREGLMRFIVNLYLAAAGMKVSALEANKIVEVSQFPPSPYRAGEQARVVSVDSDWTYTIRFMKDGMVADKVSGSWLVEMPFSEQFGCKEEKDSAEHVRMDEHVTTDWGKIRSPRRKMGTLKDHDRGVWYQEYVGAKRVIDGTLKGMKNKDWDDESLPRRVLDTNIERLKRAADRLKKLGWEVKNLDEYLVSIDNALAEIGGGQEKHGSAASALDRTIGLFFEKGNRWSGILENLKESFPDLTDEDINGIKEEIRRRVEQYKIQLESSLKMGQSQTGIPPDPSTGWNTTMTDFDSFRGRGYNKLRSRGKDRPWPGGKPEEEKRRTL